MAASKLWGFMQPSSGKASGAALFLLASCGNAPPHDTEQDAIGAVRSTLASPIYLRPTDDATVVSLTHANTNYGADPTLQVDAVDSEGGAEHAYLQFSIGSVAGQIGRARLRLEVLAASSNAADIHPIFDTSWKEDTITWNNRPFISGTPLASIVGATIGQLVYTDVTSVVAPHSTVTFALAPRSSDSADFASKEHPVARRPSLIIDDIVACLPPASTPTGLTSCGPDLATGSAGDVTSELVHAAGVTVTQLTDSEDQWNMITYYDIPAIVAGSNRFVYSRVRAGTGNYAATMTLDGDDPKVITNSPESGKNVFVTPNGAMAYFPREDPSSHRIDIQAVDLNGSTCAESPIVQNLPLPPDPSSITQLSTASRSCPIDKWVIAVATENRVYRYKGKSAGEGLWASMGSFILGDDLSAQKFHRLRLSPTCPNILMYSRDRADGRSDKDIYLTDLDRQPEVPYFLSFGQKARDAGITPFRRVPSHEMWSNDGLSVAYIQSTEGQFEPRKLVIGNILNPDCTFRTTNPDGSSNLEGTSGIAGHTFKGNVIYHTGDAASYVPKFCSWSADDLLFACSGYQYSTDCNGDFIEDESAIFLLDPSTGVTRFLSMTHELPQPDPHPCASRDPHLEPYEDPYEGQSHLQFAGDKTTILFDSDRLVGTQRLPGQVYKLSYPQSMLP